MNKPLNKIDKLIAELCPEGVEYQAIGDFGNLVRGNGMPKTDFMESGVGCIHYGQIYTYYGIWTTETISFVSTEKAKKFAKVDPGDLVITNTSENVDDVCKAVAWLGDTQIVTGGHATVLKHNQNAKFLSYYLQTPNFFAEKKKHATGTKVIDVSAKNLAKILIPTPPLAIQQEIVKILDTFTTLEAELEAELEARKKQYEYYRDELLTFGEDVEWKTLGDICNIRTGQAPNIEISSNEGNYPFINAGLEPSGYLIETNTPAETITIPSRGQGGAGHVGYQKSEFWCGPLCYKIQSSKREFITKFIYYYLRTIQEKIVGLRQTGSIPAVNRKELILIKIPAIAIYEQERIVAILDKFDALVNDISVGLPAELNARRKQYEYYRNKLLTFKPLEKVHANQYPI